MADNKEILKLKQNCLENYFIEKTKVFYFKIKLQDSRLKMKLLKQYEI